MNKAARATNRFVAGRTGFVPTLARRFATRWPCHRYPSPDESPQWVEANAHIRTLAQHLRRDPRACLPSETEPWTRVESPRRGDLGAVRSGGARRPDHAPGGPSEGGPPASRVAPDDFAWSFCRGALPLSRGQPRPLDAPGDVPRSKVVGVGDRSPRHRPRDRSVCRPRSQRGPTSPSPLARGRILARSRRLAQSGTVRCERGPI